MNKNRLEAYSDGVFVIAATLLVLNFTVPVVGNGLNTELAAKLFSLWPQLLIFLLSFGVIGNIWRLHSAIVGSATIIDHTTVMLNMLLLASTAFIPFATNVAGTYPASPAAAVLYSATLLFSVIVGNSMVINLIRTKAYGTVVPPVAYAAMRRMRVVLVIRFAGFVCAFFAPVVSYAIFWIILMYYVFVSDIDVGGDSTTSLETASTAR
jgi:uncharacterized membrane protein